MAAKLTPVDPKSEIMPFDAGVDGARRKHCVAHQPGSARAEELVLWRLRRPASERECRAVPGRRARSGGPDGRVRCRARPAAEGHHDEQRRNWCRAPAGGRDPGRRASWRIRDGRRRAWRDGADGDAPSAGQLLRAAAGQVSRAECPGGVDQSLRAAIDPNGFTFVVVGDAAKVRPQLDKLGIPVQVVEAP